MNRTRKKILIVVESIDVEDSSGAKGRVALINNLHKCGYHLKVFHYTRQQIDLSGIECVAIKENRHSLLFFLSRLERQLRHKAKLDLHKPLEQFFGFSFTLFNDRNSIVAALKKTQDFEPDLVLTLSQGGSFRPHHVLLRIPKWHKKWMAYIHDPYPMHSYPRPYDWVESGHQKKRKFFLQIAEKAEYAVYPSLLLARWMESYYSKLKGKAVIVPHQINEQDNNAIEIPEFFEKNAFSIVHAGTLLSARNPMSLISAFQKFLRKFPEAGKHSQLLFLGSESIYSRKFLEIKKALPQLYISAGKLPFKKVLAIQQQATVNVILEAKGPISPFLPGKFPHCVAAKKPILLLGPYYSECRRLLGEDYEYWSEIDDEEKIINLIEILYLKWKKDPENLRLTQLNMDKYLSIPYLKEVIDGIR